MSISELEVPVIEKKTRTRIVKEKAIDTDNKSQREMELEQRLLLLENMIANMAQTNTNTSNIIEQKKTVELEDEEIPFRKFIRVMSLTNGRLTLSTEGYGRGVVYNFIDFGEMQNIIYDDLAKIIHNNWSFAKEGAFYIMHETVLKLHGLTNFYNNNILSKDSIINILSMDGNKVQEVFKHTTPTIQQTIVSILVDKIVNGDYVDLNKVEKISEIYGRSVNEIAKNRIRK